MDLIERYLAAIARELPKAKAADITAELKDILLTQVEAKEEELGRRLQRGEVEAILKAFGHPLIVASRYGRPQYLLGPEVFPFWWWTLRMVMAVAGAIFLALLVIRVATTPAPVERVLEQAGPVFWPGFLMLFGGVTLAFVVMERIGMAKVFANWRPRDLPARGVGRKPFQVASEMAMSGVFLLWWTHVIYFRNLLPIPPTVRIELAPVWSDFYWPVIAFSVGEMAINALELFRPGMARSIAGLSAIKNTAGAVILVQIIRSGHLVDVTATGMAPGGAAAMEGAFNMALTSGLGVTALVFVGKAIYHLWRLVRESAHFVGAHA